MDVSLDGVADALALNANFRMTTKMRNVIRVPCAERKLAQAQLAKPLDPSRDAINSFSE